MPEPTSNGMQCNEFDALLADAIDGVLSGAQLDRFQAHARTCAACGPLLADAEAGRSWMKELSQIEPPVGLVESILASTTGIASDRLLSPVRPSQAQVSWLERSRAWLASTIDPFWATVRQPRFAMSFGMAFFTLSVALSVAGVKPTDLRQVSLRPSAIRRTYYSTHARVVRYYDNIRFVYELQARVRELKRDVSPVQPGSDKAPAKEKERKNDTTQEPEQKQERNYSQTENAVVLASAPLGPSVNDLPVVSVTTYRRLV